VVPPTELDRSPTMVVEEGVTTGLLVGCRPGSTWAERPRRSYRGPLPLLLLGHMDGVFLPYGSTHQLVEGLALERHEVLTDLGTEPLPKQGRVLLIWVSVV
jgi:hypothetical protein